MPLNSLYAILRGFWRGIEVVLWLRHQNHADGVCGGAGNGCYGKNWINKRGGAKALRGQPLSITFVVRGSDYKRSPTLHYDNDGRREQIHFSCSSLQSTSVLGTDTYKKQQVMLLLIGLREPSIHTLIAFLSLVNIKIFGVIFLRCHDIVLTIVF